MSCLASFFHCATAGRSAYPRRANYDCRQLSGKRGSRLPARESAERCSLAAVVHAGDTAEGPRGVSGTGSGPGRGGTAARRPLLTARYHSPSQGGGAA